MLVQPAGPLNVGSVARLCANFSDAALALELRLVAPRCDPLDPEARRMAVHGGAWLERARRFPDLAAALADCGRVVATSGRGAGEPLPLLPLEPALGWLLAATEPASGAAVAAPPEPLARPVALVFGREDRGLTNGELLQAGRLLAIGTGPGYGSLNLSHAVAVVLQRLHELLHELQAASTVPGLPAPGMPAPELPEPELPEPALRQRLEALLGDAQALLLEVGFLYPHTARARMAKVRQLLQRAQAGEQDVALLRGMVRQLRWACRQRGT